MNGTTPPRLDDLDDRLRDGIRAATCNLPSLSPDEAAAMARAAALREGQPKRRGLRRPRVVAIAVAFAALLAAPVLAGVGDELERIAELTGVREQAPEPRPADYEAAEVPYISVQPLMRYVGSSTPVVPVAAVVERGGRRLVFVTGPVIRYTGGSTSTPLRVRARPVRTSERIGNAVVVTSGVEPCDAVVVVPPPALADGDRIRSYHELTAEGPQIDFAKLFPGRAEAPPPAIDGGIVRQDGSRVVVAIHYRGAPPANAVYRVEAPDGSSTVVPYNYEGPFTEARIEERALRMNEPVADVELRDASGAVVARGSLEWFCTG
ncbi:MAG: hypothetical protein M3321_03230 [Actinomycetota bacterium]|nr:hypothetical protein [Actinomycetota bacterium]